MERSPIRLDSVVEVDRHRIDAVLAEASRPTETPGVTQDLAVDVIATMRAHLDVLDQVIGSVRADHDGSEDGVRQALMMFEATLEPAELAQLRLAWARHGEVTDRMIDAIRGDRGHRTIARLGYDFSDQLEAHGYRRPRPVASRAH